MQRILRSAYIKRFFVAFVVVGLSYTALVGAPTYIRQNKKAPDSDLIGLRLAMQEIDLILQQFESFTVAGKDMPAIEEVGVFIDRLEVSSESIQTYSSAKGLSDGDVAQARSVPANVHSLTQDYESRVNKVEKLIIYEPALDLNTEGDELALRASNTADALRGFLDSLEGASVDFNAALDDSERCFRGLAADPSSNPTPCIESYSTVRSQATLYASEPFRGSQAQNVRSTTNSLISRINELIKN